MEAGPGSTSAQVYSTYEIASFVQGGSDQPFWISAPSGTLTLPQNAVVAGQSSTTPTPFGKCVTDAIVCRGYDSNGGLLPGIVDFGSNASSVPSCAVANKGVVTHYQSYDVLTLAPASKPSGGNDGVGVGDGGGSNGPPGKTVPKS